MRRLSILTSILSLASGSAGLAQSRLPEVVPPAVLPVARPAIPPAVSVIDCPPAKQLAPGQATPNLSGPAQNALEQAVQDTASPFAQGIEGGGFASRTYDTAMFGDYGGVSYRRNVFVNRREQVGTTPRVVSFNQATQQSVIVQDPVFADRTVQRTVNLPLNGRYSGVKMSDQEGPRPTDRIYFAYSYYQGVNSQINSDIQSVDQHRQSIGFEKTLLGGDFSVGLRLPFVQTVGEGTIGGGNVGDLTISLKYAFVNDLNTGTVRSAGLLITTPTGNATATLVDGSSASHPTLLQPWLGFQQPLTERLYSQGFSSIMVPTSGDSAPTLIFNSFSVGYWLMRSENGATGLIPVSEIHINTPLTNRDSSSAIFVEDQINMTQGLHVVLPRAVIGAAITYPLLSPRPFNAEGLFTVNFRF